MANRGKICAYNQMLLDNFEIYLSYESYSPSTIKHYVDDIKMFFKWMLDFNKNKSFTNCTSNDVNRFLDYLMNVKCIGFRRTASVRRSVYLFCKYVKYIEEDDIQIVF